MKLLHLLLGLILFSSVSCRKDKSIPISEIKGDILVLKISDEKLIGEAEWESDWFQRHEDSIRFNIENETNLIFDILTYVKIGEDTLLRYSFHEAPIFPQLTYPNETEYLNNNLEFVPENFNYPLQYKSLSKEIWDQVSDLKTVHHYIASNPLCKISVIPSLEFVLDTELSISYPKQFYYLFISK